MLQPVKEFFYNKKNDKEDELLRPGVKPTVARSRGLERISAIDIS